MSSLSLSPIQAAGDGSLAKRGKRGKEVLILGDGDFSFSVAYRKKHSHTSITATEYMSEELATSCHEHRAINNTVIDYDMIISGIDPTQIPILPSCEKCAKIASNLSFLRQNNVSLFFDISGTRLWSYDSLKDKNFDCIHWNIPHDGTAQPSKTLPELMKNFFKSCAEVQSPNQHIHISIPQPKGKEFFYFSRNYALLEAATNSNYTLIKKRAFVYPSVNSSKPFSGPCVSSTGKVLEKQRYEGYAHLNTKVQVGSEDHSSNVAMGAREFVFKKIDPKTVNWLQKPSRKSPQMEACPLKATLSKAAYLAQSISKPFNFASFEKEEEGSYALAKDRRGCYVSVADSNKMVETDEDSSDSEFEM